MSTSESARWHQSRRNRQPDTLPATGLDRRTTLNHRRATSALLVSAVLTVITACGDNPDNGSTNGQPTRAADPVAAWQAYYDQTHPDFDHGRIGSGGGVAGVLRPHPPRLRLSREAGRIAAMARGTAPLLRACPTVWADAMDHERPIAAAAPTTTELTSVSARVGHAAIPFLLTDSHGASRMVD
jgi:hypothetical protein